MTQQEYWTERYNLSLKGYLAAGESLRVAERLAERYADEMTEAFWAIEYPEEE